MRLDKFLKDSKLIKRRTIAHDMCEAGKIKKDERELKPGYELKPNDVLILELPAKIMTVKVIDEKTCEILSEERKLQ